MNKKIFFLSAILITAVIAVACVVATYSGESVKRAPDGRLLITATMFPQYDFVRAIAGDKADVRLLLPPGTEGHTFEPTPADIKAIDNSDIFIYTDKSMEPWAAKIIAGVKNKKLKVVDSSRGIKLIKNGGDIDPHVWTDPLNAIAMVENIRAALCSADSKNSRYYTKNTKTLEDQIASLNIEFKKMAKNARLKTIVLGGSNPFAYFMKRYKINCAAAHDSCSGEGDASARRVAEMAEIIRNGGIKVVYYSEMTPPKMASALASETGAELVQLNSCHTVTPEEFKKGVTYVSLMKDNAEKLKKGLN